MPELSVITPHFRPDDRVRHKGAPATVLRTSIEINRATIWTSYLVQFDHDTTATDERGQPYAGRTFSASHHEVVGLEEGGDQ
jgi:hypothetical protein